MLQATPHSTDASVNSTIAVTTGGLRPSRSPRRPKIGTVMTEVSR